MEWSVHDAAQRPFPVTLEAMVLTSCMAVLGGGNGREEVVARSEEWCAPSAGRLWTNRGSEKVTWTQWTVPHLFG